MSEVLPGSEFSRAANQVTASSWWRLADMAVREFRNGFSGFWIFIACVALGVAVITAVGALSDGLRAGLADQSAEILGGDIALSRPHTRATDDERKFLEAHGRLSERVTMRTMARLPNSDDQTLVELKAVDGAYPMVGAVKLDGAKTFTQDVYARDGLAVDPILLERLQLKVGDKIQLGEAQLPVIATITKEPDGLTDRLTYGPRILLSLSSLEKTKLVQPGTLARWRYVVQLPENGGSDPAYLASFRDKLDQGLPESGFAVKDRRDPSPRISRTLDRLRQFLTLLGLTALMVGGVGVANAVATFIDRRRKVIATMKSVGATRDQVSAIFLFQILIIAAVGILVGLTVGYLLPIGLVEVLADDLPITARLVPTWTTILTATTYGLLVSLLFAVWPLARAGDVRPSVLFRDQVSDETPRPPKSAIVMAALLAGSLILFAILMSDVRHIVFYFCACVVVVFVTFYGLGGLVTRLARFIPRVRKPELALAIGNLGAPGGVTRAVVLSLGLGLSLLVAVALVDSSLVKEMTGRLPDEAPNYFVLDIVKDDMKPFEKLVREQEPEANIRSAPMLRGRLMKLKGVAVENLKADPEAEWVLRGDRGLSFSEDVPTGSKVVAGTWWPKDYDGAPQVSFEVELARGLGLEVGDTVTVNVLGRNLTARISNLREVQWESLELNFVMVFSPNTLTSAPHAMLATITLPKSTTLKQEADIARAIGKAYPNQTVIRVKDAINAFNDVFSKVMMAIRVAGSVTLLAGALVLAGAFATAQRRRNLEAVVLKTLGATRRRILTIHVTEYLLLAAVTAVVAVGLGTITAWLALTQVMNVNFVFAWMPIGLALGLASALVLIFGGLGTWTILRSKTVPYLRAE